MIGVRIAGGGKRKRLEREQSENLGGNNMEKYIFGVDLGGTTVKLGLFCQEEVVEKWEIPTRKEENGKYVLEDIAQAILEKIKEKKIEKEVIGIGIGVPGPVREDGVVKGCVNIGWGEINVAEELGKKTGYPVKAGNDANVAALGELWQGGGKGFQNLVMVTLGTGVGGGIILNGKILAGTNGAAGEIGHMPVVYDETECCNCGKKGCLEQVASASGIVKEMKKILEASDKESILRGRQISAKAVFDAIKEGDALALEAGERLGKYLGIALAHISAVVDPEIVVIGGGVSKAGNVLIELVQKYYIEKAFLPSRGVKFALATLENDAGIYGAAKLLL